MARVELARLQKPPEYRIAARPSTESLNWQVDRAFEFPYRFGRKRYGCSIESLRPLPESGLIVDPITAQFMQDHFENPGAESDALRKLLPPPKPGQATAGLLERTANPPR